MPHATVLCDDCITFRRQIQIPFGHGGPTDWSGSEVSVRSGLGLESTYQCCCRVRFPADKGGYGFVLVDTQRNERLLVPSDKSCPLVLHRRSDARFAAMNSIAKWKMELIDRQVRVLSKSSSNGSKRKSEDGRRPEVRDEHEREHEHQDRRADKKPKIKISIKTKNVFEEKRASVSRFSKPDRRAEKLAVMTSSSSGRRVLPPCRCQGFMASHGMQHWTACENLKTVLGPRDVYLNRNYFSMRKGSTCCCYQHGDQSGWVVYNRNDPAFVPTSKRAVMMDTNEKNVQEANVLPELWVLTCIEPRDKVQPLLDFIERNKESADLEFGESWAQSLSPRDLGAMRAQTPDKLTVAEFVKILQDNCLGDLASQASWNLFRAVCEMARANRGNVKLDVTTLAAVLGAERVDCSTRCFQTLDQRDIIRALELGVSSCGLVKFLAECAARKNALALGDSAPSEESESEKEIRAMMLCRRLSGVEFESCRCRKTRAGQTWLTFALAPSLRLAGIAPTRAEGMLQAKLKALEEQHRVLLEARSKEASAQVTSYTARQRVSGQVFWDQFAEYMDAVPEGELSRARVTRELAHVMATALGQANVPDRCFLCEKIKPLVLRPCNYYSCTYRLCAPCMTKLERPLICPNCCVSTIRCCDETDLEIQEASITCRWCNTVHWSQATEDKDNDNDNDNDTEAQDEEIPVDDEKGEDEEEDRGEDEDHDIEQVHEQNDQDKSAREEDSKNAGPNQVTDFTGKDFEFRQDVVDYEVSSDEE
jgi:hypothetical protein